MGGVGGHMAHLSEDLDLTFNEIIGILGSVANAEIESATEKVDGQNLFLTVNADGEIRTARNNSDVKKGGMTTDEYVSKWRGHPAESAFTGGFRAITAALRKISPESLEDIFSNGQRYVNMEIMYPKNPNIILYTTPQIVLHNLKYFGDAEGEEAEQLQQMANQKFPELAQAIDGGKEQVGEEIWTMNGPKIVALKKLADGSALEEVTQKIKSFASPVGSDAKLKDYVELVVRKYAEQVDLPPEVADKLLLLMVEQEEAKERGITVTSAKKGLPKELQSVISKLGTKTNSRKYISSILQPIEVAISDFAIEVLRGVKSFFVDEHDQEVVRMRNELDKSILYLKSLQDSGDVKMGELVDKQLAKLGNVENVASSMEGVVFEHPPGSGRIYKLTGAFAMANQIIGRARRSGMTERLADKFTVKISGDKEISKSLSEWLDEIKEAKHEYAKLPGVVYEDILSGGAIVDIVEEANALPTIYNTVLTYINTLNEEEEFEIVDQDESNPPMTKVGPKTIAIIPGAFKPPHQGHADMVRKYASMADEVVVLISKPLKNVRGLPGGGEITAEDSLNIWQLLVGDLSNVTVGIFNDPTIRSPISAAYAIAGPVAERQAAASKVEPPIEPIEPGSTVILGASTKGGDASRWKRAEEYVGKDLILKNPLETAVKPTDRPSGGSYNASDMRELLGDPQNNMLELEDFIGKGNVPALLGILGLGVEEPLEEMSSGAGGAVGGYSGPLGSTSVERTPTKKKRKKKKNENIDMSLVNEVFELLIERGIIL